MCLTLSLGSQSTKLRDREDQNGKTRRYKNDGEIKVSPVWKT